MNAVTAVVIPYFQRQQGLLARCLLSVLEREQERPGHIFVVDDASPSPAAADLALLDPRLASVVTVVKRPNGGPGAARNSALDAMPHGVRYVFLLDSDDVWLPGHLHRAVAALEQGYDLYCSNFFPEDGGPDWCSLRRRTAAGHTLLAGGGDCYALATPAMDLLALDRPLLPMMSTMGYRFERFPTLRFPENLRFAEDRYMWLQLAEAGARLVFSMAPGSRAGRGVSVYSSVQTGTLAHAAGSLDTLSFQRSVLQSTLLSALGREELARRHDQLENRLTHDLLRLVGAGEALPMAALGTTFRRHPDYLRRLLTRRS
jgi:succinoglycan biosynthesis protein ExoW